MKFIKRLLIILATMIVVLLLVSFFLPGKVHVERSMQINSPAENVFQYLNNLKTYDKWMPWNQMDPNWKVTYGAKTEGKGAWFSWESDYKEVGSGKLTIIDCDPNRKLVIDLRFPDQPDMKYGWELSPNSGGTKVIWYMNADLGNNPMDRYLGLFSNKILGKHFDQGLANLKKLSEANSLQ